MSNAMDIAPTHEVDRQGKAAFSAYLSLRRALESLEKVFASGPPVSGDAKDARVGRLATAARSLGVATDRYSPAGAAGFPDPFLLDENGLRTLAADIRSLLAEMEAAGLEQAPDAIRYLPDTERDTTVRERVTELVRGIGGAIASDYPEVALGLFGSAARGEDGPGSDIDLLLSTGPDGLTLAEESKLESLVLDTLAPLGYEVDLVPADEMRPEYVPAVRAELVTVVGDDAGKGLPC